MPCLLHIHAICLLFLFVQGYLAGYPDRGISDLARTRLSIAFSHHYAFFSPYDRLFISSCCHYVSSVIPLKLQRLRFLSSAISVLVLQYLTRSAIIMSSMFLLCPALAGAGTG